jgi:hypothetical protein
MSHIQARIARKPRPCGSFGCTRIIASGEVYLVWTDYPGPTDEMGYATQAGHPLRSSECETCARRYGRAHLVESRNNS